MFKFVLLAYKAYRGDPKAAAELLRILLAKVKNESGPADS